MSEEPADTPANNTPWASGLGKEYDVPQSKTKAFMVENAQWDRIRSRVSALESRGGIDWLMGAATLIAGIAASAGLALLALPKATKGAGEFAPFVRPTLWAVLIGGLALAVAMGLLWAYFRRSETKTAADICNEMNTIQEAWVERESPSPTPAPADGA